MRQCKRVCCDFIKVSQPGQFVLIDLERLDGSLDARLFTWVSMSVHWNQVFQFFEVQVFAALVRH